jgi:hypothetical protein
MKKEIIISLDREELLEAIREKANVSDDKKVIDIKVSINKGKMVGAIVRIEEYNDTGGI